MKSSTKAKRRKQQSPENQEQFKNNTAFTADMRLIYTRSIPGKWRDDLEELELEENTTVGNTLPIYN